MVAAVAHSLYVNAGMLKCLKKDSGIGIFTVRHLRQFGISVPASGSARHHWSGTNTLPSFENETNPKFKGHCDEFIFFIEARPYTSNDYYILRHYCYY